MKINVTTNIRSNTKKFSSVDELPTDLREIYERAMANGGKLNVSSTGPKITTRLVVNGKEIDPAQELSEVEQKLYTEVLDLLKNAGTTAAATAAKELEATRPFSSMDSGKTPAGNDKATGWLTRNQWNWVLVVAILVAMAIAFALSR